jgi:hypothetical protein
MTITDKFGNTEIGVPFSKGYHPLMLSKIQSISGSALVYLCHNQDAPIEFVANSFQTYNP